MKQAIYTFWEPQERMTPYLQLCIEKWRPFIKEFNHVILDYSNLFQFIPNDAIDIEKVKKLELLHQKDIIQAAILKYNGGIFIDADMVLVQELSPLIEKYKSYDVVTYSKHVAFMMAKKGARLIEEWHQEISIRLSALPENSPVKWDYFANSIINSKLEAKAYKACRIDKLKTAFTPELNHFRSAIYPEDHYLKFWFSETISLESVFYESQHVIALHNSWTPEWYKKMDKEKILNHPGLLSRLLSADERNYGSKKQPCLRWPVIWRMRLQLIFFRVIQFFLKNKS